MNATRGRDLGENVVKLSLLVGLSGSDPFEVDTATRRLREELLAVDVDEVAIPRSEALPDGARGDSYLVGMLLLSLTNSTVLVALCQVLRGWVTRDGRRQVKLTDGTRTLELVGSTSAQHQQIIDAFLGAMSSDSDDASPKV